MLFNEANFIIIGIWLWGWFLNPDRVKGHVVKQQTEKMIKSRCRRTKRDDGEKIQHKNQCSTGLCVFFPKHKFVMNCCCCCRRCHAVDVVIRVVNFNFTFFFPLSCVYHCCELWNEKWWGSHLMMTTAVRIEDLWSMVGLVCCRLDVKFSIVVHWSLIASKGETRSTNRQTFLYPAVLRKWNRSVEVRRASENLQKQKKLVHDGKVLTNKKKLQNHHETSTHVLDFIHTIESFVSSEAPKKTTV